MQRFDDELDGVTVDSQQVLAEPRTLNGHVVPCRPPARPRGQPACCRSRTGR